MMVCAVVEGASDVQAVRKLIESCGHQVSKVIEKRGKGNLDRDLPKYNLAAAGQPYIVFRDTDGQCPVELRKRLLAATSPLNPHLVLRLADTMTEAWLLADRSGFAAYFGVSKDKVPRDPDSLPDGKRTVLNLCQRSRKRDIREGMVADGAEIGPRFVSLANEFARDVWNVTAAAEASPSLRRAIASIRQIGPASNS